MGERGSLGGGFPGLPRGSPVRSPFLLTPHISGQSVTPSLRLSPPEEKPWGDYEHTVPDLEANCLSPGRSSGF